MAVVEPKEPRFHREIVEGGEQILIPARRNWFVMLFLPFWLIIWTIGGVVAFYSLFNEFRFFVVFWLVGWAAGWIYAATALAWNVNGREVLRVVAGDLLVELRGLGFRRTRQYRGHEIRHLSANLVDPMFGQFSFQVPILMAPRSGVVKFDYGSKQITPPMDWTRQRAD